MQNRGLTNSIKISDASTTCSPNLRRIGLKMTDIQRNKQSIFHLILNTLYKNLENS